MKLSTLFILVILMAMGASAQIPNPQISLTGNIGCQGFPCFNTGQLILGTDANHSMTALETSATSFKFTSSVSLTATRNMIFPAGKFQLGCVENLTTGGQSIQIIGPSGTGVTIPNGATVCGLWNDGTNFITGSAAGGITQLTGDVTAGPGSGSQATTLARIAGVPFCAGFTPTTGQALTYTTASSPNPCYTAVTSGGLSGQTTGCVPLANSATTSTSSAPICDDGTTTTISHPVAMSGSGPPITINASSTATPAATKAVLGTDSSGNLMLSNNGAAASAILRLSDSALFDAAGAATTAQTNAEAFSANAGNLSSGVVSTARGGTGAGVLTGLRVANGASADTAATGAQVATAISGQAIAPKFLNGVSYSTLYSGASVDARVNACLTDALNLANGNTTGICDASAETGTQTTVSQITVGDTSSDPVTLILPTNGQWLGGMTDGTSAVIKQYTGTSVFSRSPTAGFGNNFSIQPGPSSNLGYVYLAISAGTPGSYMYAANFAVANTSSGHVTASGVGTYIEGPFYDNTTFEHMYFQDAKDASNVVGKGICCSTTFRNDQFQGSYVSAPLAITTVGAPSGSTSVGINIVDSSIVHPGSGLNVFSCTDSSAHDTTLNLSNIYTETSNSDGTTELYKVNGCGDVSFKNLTFRCEVSGPNCTNPAVSVTNAFNTVFTANDLSFSNGTGSWTFTAVAVSNANSSQTIKTDSNGHLAFYSSGTAYTPGLQTSVDGGVVQLGTGAGADNWINLSGIRGMVGYKYTGGDLVVASQNRDLFATNASAWGTWTVSGLFDENGNFGVGTNATNATSDPFHVTPSGVVTLPLIPNMASATVASATTIAPTTPLVVTSGTTSIATITLPSGFTTGCFDLIPSGTQATTTAGNISAVYTLTANTLYRACYNGTKWYIK